MGTTLTGTTPQDTYDSLIKVTDNGPLSGTAKYLSDGLGNDSVLALSTSRVGVGTNAPSYDLTLSKSVAAGNVVLQIENTSTTGSARLWFGNNANAAGARIQYFGATHVQRPNLFSIGTDAANDVMFETSGSERMRITDTGNVGIGTSSPTQKLSVVNGSIFTSRTDSSENIIISDGTTNSSIQQVTHLYLNSGGNSATFGDVIFRTKNSYTEMARFTSNGLCFNGDTAAANALDDYEEGTWTMGVSFGGASVGLTYGVRGGTYTKIGRQVTVNGLLTFTNKGTSTGAANITGLPFAIASGDPMYPSASLTLFNATFAGQYFAYGNIGSTSIAIEQLSELGAVSALNDTNFANNSSLIVSVTYYV